MILDYDSAVRVIEAQDAESKRDPLYSDYEAKRFAILNERENEILEMKRELNHK